MKDPIVSEWLPATYKVGTLSVFIDGTHMTGEQLQQNGYTIDGKNCQ